MFEPSGHQLEKVSSDNGAEFGKGEGLLVEDVCMCITNERKRYGNSKGQGTTYKTRVQYVYFKPPYPLVLRFGCHVYHCHIQYMNKG